MDTSVDHCKLNAGPRNGDALGSDTNDCLPLTSPFSSSTMALSSSNSSRSSSLSSRRHRFASFRVLISAGYDINSLGGSALFAASRFCATESCASRDCIRCCCDLNASMWSEPTQLLSEKELESPSHSVQSRFFCFVCRDAHLHLPVPARAHPKELCLVVQLLDVRFPEMSVT